MAIDFDSSKRWLGYALLTTVFWGVWGALIELPEKNGFPATLGYVVWAITMIPPCIFALYKIDWKIDFEFKSILFGSLAGLLGAGGQLILFQALRIGPAYLVFPFISLSPVITILLATLFLKEKTRKLGWLGIALALLAIPLLSYQEPTNSEITGKLWIFLSLIVFMAWGIQAYVLRFANEKMHAENIFFYMTVTGLILIPIALAMTDFTQSINWGFSGFYSAALIQLLNAIGALSLVYAFRYGKAIVVSPMTNALAPVITIILSLLLYSVIPSTPIILGMILAIAASFLLGVEEETENISEVDEKKLVDLNR
ncbi:MAG TPA: EamA family transporter [Balneolaceae bacterium]